MVMVLEKAMTICIGPSYMNKTWTSLSVLRHVPINTEIFIARVYQTSLALIVLAIQATIVSTIPPYVFTFNI